MKRRWKALVTALCVLALAVTPMFTAWGDDASYGEMRATAQNSNNTAIQSFTLNNTFNYETLGVGVKLDSGTLQNIVKTKLLPQWSPIAASVFHDQANQLVDLYGCMPIGGNMSGNGFDAYFNGNYDAAWIGEEYDYSNETWSCNSLASKLGQVNASHSGDRGWDQFTVTGLKRISNLSEARNLMGQALRDCEKTNAVSAQEFLDADEAGEKRLDALDDDTATTGFANVVTAVNCKGSSANFDYVSFGIVFYDFKPVPVAATGLKYANTHFVTTTSTPESNPTNHSTVTNGSAQDIMHSAVLGDAVTQTTSTELSALASFELSENIGANIGVSQTESSSETSFWADPTFGAGSSTSTSSETISMGLDWGTAWKMGGSLGAKEGHSESKEVSKAVETTIALPPHTGTSIKQEASTTTNTQTYQQPVVLSYKVAIYAMSGDFYSSSAFGGIGGINGGNYDKQSLVIKFDSKEDEKDSYGCAATDDLYYRIANNNKVDRYDVADGRTYSTHSTASGWTKSEEIDWRNVIEKADARYHANVATLAKQNYFYETPGKLEAKTDKTSSSVETTYPLYNLADVKTTKPSYTLYNNNALDLNSLPLQGYNRYGVAFYGFNSDWGEWKLFDNEAKELAGNNGSLEGNAYFKYDPLTKVISPKDGVTQKQIIYLKWEFKAGQTVKTGEANPQNLTTLNEGYTVDNEKQFHVPIVRIEILNTGLDNPRITAEGSYTGYYKTPINLNSVMKYEVASQSDKVVDAQAKWEARELVSAGIEVNASTGDVTFSKPGTYHVRPYVVNNKSEEVYPMNGTEYAWLTVIATEHDLMYYEAKAPTDCTGGDAYGWIGHYRCSDCGRYFLDAAGTLEVSQDKVIINPPGHDWGEWEAVKGDPTKEQRVCRNYSNHVQTRDVYTVTFDVNKPEKATENPAPAPDAQRFTSDTRASVEVPKEPTLAGYTFDGWCTNKEGTVFYDFSSAVNGSFTLYAKWVPVKYTVATVAVVSETTVDKDGGSQQTYAPATDSSIAIAGMAADSHYTDADQYVYYYKEVEFGEPVELTVLPKANYGLKEIQAVPVLAISATDASTGESFTPERIGETDSYKITMPAADVAVVGSFAQEWVDVTYNAGTLSNNENVTVPANERIRYGSTIAGLGQKLPTLPNDLQDTWEFGGWFTDEALKTPCLATTSITKDTTLYAKWITKEKAAEMKTVTYTLMYRPAADFDPDDASYKVEINSAAYDPTDDLYTIAGEEALTAYKLQKDEGSGSCWFKSYENDVLADPFVFSEDKITEDTHLYAQVVPQTYTVTYYDGQKKLGEQVVEYNSLLKQADADAKAPAKEGQTLSGWTTKGELWDFEKDHVTNNLALYAEWTTNKYTVTFNANGHGTAPAPEKDVKHGDKAQRPEAPTAEGYIFGGWCTDADCTVAYDFAAPVTSDLTLYAKWTPVKKDLSGAKITLSEKSYVYDYTAKQPAVVSVELDGAKLEEGKDYELAYVDNVEVGSPAMVAAPTVTVSGIGNYYGKATTTFEITSPAHAARLTMADLDSTAWYMSRESGVGAFPGTQTLYLDHTMALGLMTGYKDAAGNLVAFGPNDELERCQAATIVYRLANPDSVDTTDPAQYASENTTGLSDVEAGKFYTAAVNWCVANGTITGYKGDRAGQFGPHDPITREQLATIVGRYMDPQGTAGTDVSMFKDQAAISDWAKGGIAYCSKEGIMTGIGDTGNFGPQELSLRCQMSKVIAVVHRLGHEPGNAVATQAEPASNGALMAGSAAL